MTGKKGFRFGLLASASIALASLGSLAQAQDTKSIAVAVQSQSLGDSLNQLARQANVQIVFRPELVRGKQAPELAGSLTVDQALSRALEGSGLRYQASGPGAYVVLAQVPEVRPMQTGGGAKPAPASPVLAVEEIVVTAQKRTENLQNVPISVAVVSGAQLDSSSTTSVTEALNNVPGVAATPYFQGGMTTVTIRGAAAAGGSYFGSSPVAYYLDTIPFGLVRSAMAPDSSAYDLERVEVLRGPQGTLYGASAQNGVVRVLTHPADLDHFDLKARTSVSGTEHGDPSYSGDMAVNVPIIDDRFAARAVVGYQDLGGWIDRPNAADRNDAKVFNGRLKLNAQPTDSLSLGFTAWSSRARYGAPSTGLANGTNTTSADERIKNNYDAFGFTAAYEFPTFTVTSMSSYIDYRSRSSLDLGFLFGAPTPLATNRTATVKSEELLLSSTKEGPWRWTLGGFYRNADEHVIQIIGAGAPFDDTDESESRAVYGEITRLFFDDSLELTAGLRYFNDDSGVHDNLPLSGNPADPLIRANTNSHAVTPRFVVTYHPNGNTTLYTSYSEGFRAGITQQTGVIQQAPQIPAAKPDLLRNYEIGAKGDIWDRRLTYDAAVYYMDWARIQQPITVPVVGPSGQSTPFSALLNGPSASGVGVDLGLAAHLTDSLSLSVAASWNNLTLDRDLISGGVLLFSAGDRLNFSPAFTGTASVDYRWAIGGGYNATLATSVNYSSRQENRTLAGNARVFTVGDKMVVGRVSLAIDAPKNWTATVFVDNFTGENGTPIRAAIIPNPDWDARIRPRTYGLRVEYHY